jgi:hypothetical protein
MLGLVLFYVGAVLCLNGLWLLGRIGDKEIAVIDTFVGSITLLVALYLAFGPGSDLGSIKAAALTLLFTFTPTSGWRSTATTGLTGVAWAGFACSSRSRRCR